jgi:hypothetical protein
MLLAVLGGGAALLLFGDEPWQASDGALNPLAVVPPAVLGLFALALIPQIVGLVRRPAVGADHYAMVVRPGVIRTLVVPWADVVELTAFELDEEYYLLIRCRGLRTSGDEPRWFDRSVLRSVIRGASNVAAYDLAVPMTDFAGTPEDLLAALGEWAPDHVALVRARAAT